MKSVVDILVEKRLFYAINAKLRNVSVRKSCDGRKINEAKQAARGNFLNAKKNELGTGWT